MVMYLGLDDTDMPDTIGTGRLAREIAKELGKRYPVICITRHQFLIHPDIPYTSHNSGAVIHFEKIPEEERTRLFDEAVSLMHDRFINGSDPGLCLADQEQITAPVIIFGQDAKSKVLTLDEAGKLAGNLNIRLAGLGGTNGGIIGALAGVGLAASGMDGRYLEIGRIRECMGPRDAKDLIKLGIDKIISKDGRSVSEGMINIKKFPQPVRISGSPILLVEEISGEWHVVKRD